jgi:hypothetical protein
MADPTFEAELRAVLEEGASNTCASPTEAPGAPRSRFAVISVPLKRCSSYFFGGMANLLSSSRKRGRFAS